MPPTILNEDPVHRSIGGAITRTTSMPSKWGSKYPSIGAPAATARGPSGATGLSFCRSASAPTLVPDKNDSTSSASSSTSKVTILAMKFEEAQRKATDFRTQIGTSKYVQKHRISAKKIDKIVVGRLSSSSVGGIDGCVLVSGISKPRLQMSDPSAAHDESSILSSVPGGVVSRCGPA